jgi:hypothetical protein
MRRAFIGLAALVPLLQLALTTALAWPVTGGTWSIDASRGVEDANLALRLGDARGGHESSSSHDVDAAKLGLTAALESHDETHVAFEIVREAGTIVCSGVARDHRAGGTFRFAPSAQFVTAMRTRGYALDDEQLFRAASLDVTVAFVDGIVAAGYRDVPFEKIVVFRALNVDGSYLRELNGSFDTRPTVDDVIPLRALGVTGSYVSGLRDAGLRGLTPREAIRVRAMSIDAAFVKRVRAHGFQNPTIDDVVRLKAMGIVHADEPETKR